MKKIFDKVERTSGGFSAYAEKYPAFTTGKNSSELTEKYRRFHQFLLRCPKTLQDV